MNPNSGYAIQDASFGDLLVATGTPVFCGVRLPLEVRRSLFVCFFFPEIFRSFGAMLNHNSWNCVFVDTFSVTFFVCTIWDLWNSMINMDKLRNGACFFEWSSKWWIEGVLQFSLTHSVTIRTWKRWSFQHAHSCRFLWPWDILDIGH